MLDENPLSDSPVNWGCRIHRLHLCRGTKTPTLLNECHIYDIKQSDGKGSSLGALGNVKYSFIAITHWPTLT